MGREEIVGEEEAETMALLVALEVDLLKEKKIMSLVVVKPFEALIP